MKRIGTLLWVLAAVWAGLGAARADTPPCRYLILYDASLAMTKAAPAGSQAVASLIYGGFQGQLKPGEMFNVWLFNQQVYTNRFAPMTWQPGARQALADNTLALLKILKYEKEAKMSVLWREVLQAARNTETLTVFLLTASEQPFQGTPFDAVLNQLTKDHAKELRRAKKPLLATLVAVHGQLVAYTIGMAGNPIDFASLDHQLERAYPSQPAPALVTNIIVTNIILVTNPVPATAAPPVAVANVDQEPKPAPTPKPEAAPAATTPVASNEPPSAVLAPPPAVKPAEPVSPPVAAEKPAEPVAAPPAQTTQTAQTTPTVAEPVKPKEPEVAAPAEPIAEPPAAKPKETNPAPAEPVVAANPTNPVAPAPPASPATDAAPATVAATSAPPPTSAAPASNELAPLLRQTQAKREPVPQHWEENRNWGFGVFALASVVAGIALFSILRGRSKRKAPPSFISQSIDRHTK